MRQKTIILILLASVLALGVVGGFFYFWKTNGAPNGFYHGQISIGVDTWPGYVALFVAQDKGFFKDKGLDVKITNYNSLSELANDYLAGKLHGRGNLTMEAINESLGGFDHKIVSIIDYSNGADAIVGKKDILSVAGLKGKRVAFEYGTLEEFFLACVLKTENLFVEDIVKVNATAEEAVKMLERGEVDAAVSYEPYIGAAVSNPEFRKIISSREASGLITDVLTLRTDFITSYPKSVSALIAAYFEGLDYAKAHPDEAAAIFAPHIGVTAEDIKCQLEGVEVLSLEDNLAAFAPGFHSKSIYSHLNDIGQFIVLRSKYPDYFNTASLVDASFVNSLSGPVNQN